MDFNKIMDLLTKSNVNSEAISSLINEASKMDLSDEDSQRELIRMGAQVTGKKLSKEMEDKIIAIIKDKGISNDLFNYVK